MKRPRTAFYLGSTGVLVLSLGSTACGGDEPGSLTVLVEAEDTIQHGIAPGDAAGMRDGWTATFDRYVVVLGDIELELSTDHETTAGAPAAFAVDLTRIPSAGLPLWSLDGLEPGRWEFHYSTLGAGDDAERHESVSQPDFDAMRAGDSTYLIEGRVAKSDGRSCPPVRLAEPPADAEADGENSGGDACYSNTSITFRFEVEAETVFGPCEIDGISGVSVPSGGSQSVALTIHGDHLFFNGFPTGSEGSTMRLAQWLADSDLDVDGEVTREELERIRPSDLPEMDTERYELGGSPIPELESQSLWVYVSAQLKTQGHLQGEGECQIDGEGHAH